jgi:hypothetical protein
VRALETDRFAAYYAARYRALRRTAYFLCGDWHEADDLTQAAFVRLYLAWGRVRADGAHAYARRVLVNEFLGRRRRRREEPVDPLPDRPVPTAGSPEDRVDLSAAVRGGGTPVRYVGRVFPDGRAIGIYLNFTGGGGSFERLSRSLDQLAALVTDPQALRYFPRP